MSLIVYSKLEGKTLSSRSEYLLDGKSTVLETTSTVAEPLALGVGFWAAWNGQVAAFSAPECCIASMEDAVRGLLGPQRDKTTMGRVYVTTRPKTATRATWNNWCKKWAKRTAEGTAY